MFATGELFDEAIRRKRKKDIRKTAEAEQILEGALRPFVQKYMLPMLDGLIVNADAVIDDMKSTEREIDFARGMRRTAVVLRGFILDSIENAQRVLRDEDSAEEETAWIP